MRYEEPEQICGCVQAVVFQNEENGYTVLRLRQESGETVTVVGTIPMTAAGERLVATGRWGSHSSYGRQFEAELLERLMPESKEEILVFLSSGAVKGIGAKTAIRIVDRFGASSLDVLENHPEQLAEVQGISPRKAKEMSELYCRQIGVRRLLDFLTQHHLPAELAVRVYKVFGDMSLEAVTDDPYMLTDEQFGGDFAVVDAFALENGILGDDERRVEAGILFELSHNLNNGHTFLPTDKLTAATVELLDLDTETVSGGMERLCRQGRMVTDEIAKIGVSYLPQYYEAERYLTERLPKMAMRRTDAPSGLEERIARIEQRQGIEYASLQKRAIAAAASNGLLIVTGGPGTGKTTTLAGILSLFDEMKLKTYLAAPTGRAAKRLSELTGRAASTIHRLLEVDISPETGTMTFLHGEGEPLQCDALIVDETSMVDLLLMEALVRAIPRNCRLILVGDPDQLPSVGAGNLFADLIASGRIETVRLTEIFRQAQESLIVMNAHAVNRGELPCISAKDRDFFFLRQLNGAEVLRTVCDLCTRRLPEKMGISASEIQVLSPTRKGECGTYALNLALQEKLNPASPGKNEKKYGNYTFREGDRIMQIRNNYDILWKKVGSYGLGTGIFNGDIGVIERIDTAESTVVIRFDDREAEYSFDMLCDLELAYAMTVHKSQGSEYRAVILATHRGSPYLLTRSVLYTAITRAKELMICVGNEEILRTMVENNKVLKRYSGLKWRLKNSV